MNTLIIAGKVVEEPQKSVSSNGVNIARFKMAVDKNGKDGSVNGFKEWYVPCYERQETMEKA